MSQRDQGQRIYSLLGFNVEYLGLDAKRVKLSQRVYTWLGCSEDCKTCINVIGTQRVKED